MGALLSSRLARVSGVCLWGISIVALTLGVLHKAHRVNGNDFTMYLDAARALIDGRNPYTLGGTLPYMYPLFLAAVLGPLTAVPQDVATIVWFVLSVASLLGAVRVMVGLARAEGVVPSGVPLTVPLVALWFLFFDPIQNNLLNGQINFQILLLCVLSLRAYLGRRTLGSAWPLAAAIAVKLTPALLLGFLGIRRRWAAIVLCLVLGAAFVLAPVVLPGAQGGQAYRNFVHSVLLPRLHSEYPAHRGVRFSVNGALGALVPAWNQASWRRAVGVSLPLLGLAAVEILSRRRRTTGQELWIFCLYLLAQPLITPLSEVHHLVYALPAAGLLALRSLPARSEPRAEFRLVGLAAAWLLFAGGWIDRDGPYFFLALCLIGALVAVEALRNSAPRAAEGSGPLSARS